MYYEIYYAIDYDMFYTHEQAVGYKVYAFAVGSVGQIQASVGSAYITQVGNVGVSCMNQSEQLQSQLQEA